MATYQIAQTGRTYYQVGEFTKYAFPARGADVVLASGYYDVIDGTPFGALKTVSGRSYLSRNNLTKIRQTDSITKVKLDITNISNINIIFFDVWRYNGSTWDEVTHTDITILLTGDEVNTITLPSPVAVQEGDFIGISGILDSAGDNFSGLGLSGGLYYVDGMSPSPITDPYNWAAGTNFDYYFPIQTYTQAPYIVGMGHSIMAGHDGHFSMVEDSIKVDLDGHVMYQLQQLENRYVYQNMGIGSNTSTQMLARFTADVVDLKPKMVVIFVGVTDIIIGGISKSTFLSNVTAMLDSCVTNSIIPVVGKATPWTNGTTDEMQQLDEWMADLAALVGGYFGSVWANFDTDMGQFREGGDAENLWDLQAAYDGDGIHLTVAGYIKAAAVVNDAIDNLYE